MRAARLIRGRKRFVMSNPFDLISDATKLYRAQRDELVRALAEFDRSHTVERSICDAEFEAYYDANDAINAGQTAEVADDDR
jgi:hypothetical protein